MLVVLQTYVYQQYGNQTKKHY